MPDKKTQKLASSPRQEENVESSAYEQLEIVDTQRIYLDETGRQETSSSALVTLRDIKPDTIVECRILIAGGGLGGVSAALSAATSGQSAEVYKADNRRDICLTEETDWLGGQMTAQGVSALDENPLVETSGSSRSYQNLRQSIRMRYKKNHKLDDTSSQDPWLNPGDCWVSWLAFEPQQGLKELENLLAPHVRDGSISVFLRHKPVYVKTVKEQNGDTVDAKEQLKVTAVGMVDLETRKCVEFRPLICLDATELGELLPLAGLDYRTGAESGDTTGEPHAPQEAKPDNVQDFVYPFVVEYCPDETHLISKPPYYDDFAKSGKFSFQGYPMFECKLSGDENDWLIDKLPFWEYRRLIASRKFLDDSNRRDLAMINWDSNDLRGENIIDKPPLKQIERLRLAKALSLGFLYWLQTEAPRDDGSSGYPELKLRKDILGTLDGLSKFPYIRESRRIIPIKPIVEQDIVEAFNPAARARIVTDSVGIGHYPVDIHGYQDVPGVAQRTRPFQIPLSALLPKDSNNLLPACKNIGTTHITNGAFRLHPIEWSIGEAQGMLAVTALNEGISFRTILEREDLLLSFQLNLIKLGVPLFWYNDVPTNHEAFEAVQWLTITGILSSSPDHLRFNPDGKMDESEGANALKNARRLKKNLPTTIEKFLDAFAFEKSKSAFEKSKSIFDRRTTESISKSRVNQLSRSVFSILLFEAVTKDSFDQSKGRHCFDL